MMRRVGFKALMMPCIKLQTFTTAVRLWGAIDGKENDVAAGSSTHTAANARRFLAMTRCSWKRLSTGA
jgi:hypothetical protein